jgi:tetratricopeptide (TPR) repeat protein
VDPSTPNQSSQSTQNHRHLRRLVMALKASYGRLNLLIAICDNWHYRDQLIRTYEGELQAENVECDRLTLDRQDPSLKHSLQTLVETTPSVISPPAIVTVLGADELLGIRLDADKSAQEHFFFSVQWTREALREFTFPIVLWLTPTIATELAQHAPDFWSWRGGVFEFSQPLGIQYIASKVLPQRFIPPQVPQTLKTLPPMDDRTGSLPVQKTRDLLRGQKVEIDRVMVNPDELEQQIQTLYHQDPDSPLLGSLSHSVGDAYKEARHYPQAEAAYRQALALREKHLGANHLDVASSLNDLATVYYNQGRYSEAESLLKRSLSIYEQQLGADHPQTATSLNNLAELYRAQGRYREAEPLYKRSLSIYEKHLGADHPDTAASLNNLAELYRAQGRYSAAEPLYKRSLSIYEKHLGPEHPDTAQSLNNLAYLYQQQGRYSEAEPLYARGVVILQNLDHPNTQAGIYNFVGCLQEAIAAGQRGLLSAHPLTQFFLEQLQ